MKLNIQNSSLKITAGRADQFPRGIQPQIALSGRSNVGKSSLINTMIGRKSLARVSAVPGKTVTINFYEIDGRMYLVDLPGYGYAARAPGERRVWMALTDSFFTDNPGGDRIKLVVQLVDSRVGITADDAAMLDFMRETGYDFIIAATKVDKMNKTERAEKMAELRGSLEAGGIGGTGIVEFSARTGEGKDELWRVILKYAGI